MLFCKRRLKEIKVFDVLTVTGKQFQKVAPEYRKLRLNDSVACLGIHKLPFDIERN